jgi:hypothetical protein
MGKSAIEGIKFKKDNNGNKLSKKASSHGSYRCKRRPNSKRCK